METYIAADAHPGSAGMQPPSGNWLLGWRIEGDFLAVLVGRWWMKHRLRVTKAPSVFGLTVLLSLEGECESEGSAAAWCWCKSHTAAESFGEGLGNGESQPGVALV